MALVEREFDIETGRRTGDAHVSVSIFADDLLALKIQGFGERTPTLLLTLEQARKLQRALAELIPLAEESLDTQTEAENFSNDGNWSGTERRH